jgi:ATP-dependent RNA helicase DDX46/PRP5
VINYSAPHHYEDYVHRIGRTGRAGTRGWSYTFIDREKEAKFTPDIVKAIKKAKMEENIPEDVLELSKQFKDKVRSGEEIDYNRRGFGEKGCKILFFIFPSNLPFREIWQKKRRFLLPRLVE